MTATHLPPAIEAAELIWRDGVPESKQFGDIYFSRENGLEESRYVFIAHNKLPERFATLPEAGSFVVAETGFGTGLNFLATWQAWKEHAPSHSATLHFISAERFPLNRKDLEKALASWPELEAFSKELIENYPPLVAGAHRLVLDGGRVRLTLFFGDIQDALARLSFCADAWFLDGFAPAVNPAMWQQAIIDGIQQHSKQGTTLATFTAAGYVRRALQQAGFAVQKPRGFGHKRSMVSGVFEACTAASKHTRTPPKALGPVAIIGAGIAGCLLAHNLANRGYAVTLIDAASQCGSAASGNLQGALYVKLGVEYNEQTELALSALTFSQRYYRRNGGYHWHPTGLLQLAWNQNEQQRQQRFWQRNHYPEELLRPVSQPQAEELSGIPLETGGLWFPGCGWIQPGKLCRSLAQHPRIKTVTECSILDITASGNLWRLSTSCPDTQDIQAEQVVICAGHLSPQILPGTGAYRFKTIRGQVTHLPSDYAKHSKTVICGARYLNPAHRHEGNLLSVIGATFDLHDNNPAPTSEGHRENLQALSAMAPQVIATGLKSSTLPEQLEGRVGFRCTTHDYQPVAGQFQDDEGRKLEGLYLFTGLGSKGLTYAPLLAEFLADQITGQPSAIPVTLAKRLATERMHLRKVAPL